MAALSESVTPSGRPYRGNVVVRFGDCDPAGIVFYPRYAEMFNNLVEDWCRDELGLSFSEIHRKRGWGLPAVHLEIDYKAPSFLGDVLSAALWVRRIGNSSIHLEIVLSDGEGRERVQGRLILVLTDAACRHAVPIPDDLRGRIAAFREGGK